MNTIRNKTIGILLYILTIPLFAEISLQENIYDAADEMIRFDEKMNRAIAEHNRRFIDESLSPIDINEELSFDSFPSNDFKETEDGYEFIQKVLNPNKTKVKIEIQGKLLIVLLSTTKKELTEFGNVCTVDSSTVSLSIPSDAHQGTMIKTYKNGILKIIFPKK